MARISLNEAMSRPANVDRAKLDATTEEDIRRHQAEDGHADVEPSATARAVIPPRLLRVTLGLTQKEMADRLRVPFATWRNWETGRVSLDPAVRSLLDIVAAMPDLAFEALQSGVVAAPRPAVQVTDTALRDIERLLGSDLKAGKRSDLARDAATTMSDAFVVWSKRGSRIKRPAGGEL